MRIEKRTWTKTFSLQIVFIFENFFLNDTEAATEIYIDMLTIHLRFSLRERLIELRTFYRLLYLAKPYLKVISQVNSSNLLGYISDYPLTLR